MQVIAPRLDFSVVGGWTQPQNRLGLHMKLNFCCHTLHGLSKRKSVQKCFAEMLCIRLRHAEAGGMKEHLKIKAQDLKIQDRVR